MPPSTRAGSYHPIVPGDKDCGKTDPPEPGTRRQARNSPGTVAEASFDA